MKTFCLLLGMTVFTCGEKGSEVTGGGTGTGTTEASATEAGTTVAVTTAVPTGTATESAGETESASAANTDDPSAPGSSSGPGSSTAAGESTGASEAGESTAGEGTTGGDTGTTGEVIVLDAALNNACAPDDGPAVALRVGLVEPACEAKWGGESLRIVIFMAAPLQPGVYPLGEGLGFATRQGVDDPDFVSGTVGSVTIEAWDGAAVVGSYEVSCADASVRAGGFSGPYCDDDILCG